MADVAAAQDQVYVSGWLKRFAATPALPRWALLCAAKLVGQVMRRRVRARDCHDADTPAKTQRHDTTVYFADIYHGGVTFWDWIVLRGGGLWWHTLWPLVIETSLHRLRTYADIRTVLEVDAHTYEELPRRHPAALPLLRALIAEGRLEIVNGTYAQPLAPTISGEANIRHLFHGLRTVREVLGATVRSFVAGEPQFFPQLPQLLASFGVTQVVFRTHWAPFGTDPVADHDIVSWRGPDGSTVRTVPRYSSMDYRLLIEEHPGVQNAGLTGDDFERWPAARVQAFAARAAAIGIRRPLVTRLADPKPPESPYPHLLGAARSAEAQLVTVDEYFALPGGPEPEVSYGANDIPGTIPWGLAGEQLYRDQTFAESALLIAERLDAIVAQVGGAAQEAALDGAWKLLLRAQHHDLLLCGPWHSTAHNTSMAQVGCHLARQSRDRAAAVSARALEVLSERFRPPAVTGATFLVFNPSPWPRVELMQLPPGTGSEVWQRGQRLTTQELPTGELAFFVELPSLGIDAVTVRPGTRADAPTPGAVLPGANLFALNGFDDMRDAYLSVWQGGWLQRSVVTQVRLEADGPLCRRYRLEGHLLDIPFVQWLTVIPALRRIELATAIDFGAGRYCGPQFGDHDAERAYYIQDEKKLCLNFESNLPLQFCDSPFLLVEPQGDRLTALSMLGLGRQGAAQLALLHRGTPGWQVDRDAGIVRNVLAWGPEQWLYASDDSMTPGRSRYTMVRGVQRYEHALALITSPIAALRAASDFRLPLVAVDVPPGQPGDALPWSALAVDPEQAILSAFFARDGRLYARVWNASSDSVECAVRTNSHEQPRAVSLALRQSAGVELGVLPPWGVQTILLGQPLQPR